MSDAKRLLPWIGGASKSVSNASYTAIVSPVDEQVSAQMIESDAAVIDAAVKNAHQAYLAHEGATTAVRQRAAQDRRVQKTRGRQVVDVLPAAAQEAQVFEALDRAADQRIRRARSRHGFPAPAAAMTAPSFSVLRCGK